MMGASECSQHTIQYVYTTNTFSFRKRTHIFRVIGQFVAKALLDSRIIDLSFNKIFLKLVLGEEVPLTIASLQVCISYRNLPSNNSFPPFSSLTSI